MFTMSNALGAQRSTRTCTILATNAYDHCPNGEVFSCILCTLIPGIICDDRFSARARRQDYIVNFGGADICRFRELGKRCAFERDDELVWHVVYVRAGTFKLMVVRIVLCHLKVRYAESLFA